MPAWPCNPFRTAAPFWGQTTPILSSVSPGGTAVLRVDLIRVDLNEDYSSGLYQYFHEISVFIVFFL